MRCVFKNCEKEIEGFGNSARPFNGRCCDDCNEKNVIPTRIVISMDARCNTPEMIAKLKLMANTDGVANVLGIFKKN